MTQFSGKHLHEHAVDDATNSHHIYLKIVNLKHHFYSNFTFTSTQSVEPSKNASSTATI